MSEQDIDAFVAELTAQENAQQNGEVEQEQDETIEAPEQETVEEVETPEDSDEQEQSDEAEQNDDELLDRISKAGEETESLPKNVQKKINRDNAARKEAEERAARLEAELEALRTKGTRHHGNNDEVQLPKTAEEFQQAIEYALEQREAKKAESERKAKEQQEFQALQLKAKAHEERGNELFEDFEQKVVPDVFSPAMALEIARIDDSTAAAKVAYYLGANPVLAKSIKALPAIDQIREIAAIKARLSVRQQSKVASSAKKPLSNVGSSAGSNLKNENVDNDTDASGVRKLNKGFDEWAKAQGIKF